jgi:hypothetical protein
MPEIPCNLAPVGIIIIGHVVHYSATKIAHDCMATM